MKDLHLLPGTLIAATLLLLPINVDEAAADRYAAPADGSAAQASDHSSVEEARDIFLQEGLRLRMENVIAGKIKNPPAVTNVAGQLVDLLNSLPDDQARCEFLAEDADLIVAFREKLSEVLDPLTRAYPYVCGASGEIFVVVVQQPDRVLASGMDFSQVGSYDTPGISHDAALGDFDGDGDVDVVVVKRGHGGEASGAPARILLNDGTGNFTDSGQELGGVSGYGVAVGDLDGDARPDIVVLNIAGPNLILWNDGGGGFTTSTSPPGSSRSYRVAIDDLDQDGDNDIVIANDFGGANQVLRNDGGRNFTVSQDFGNCSSTDLVLADLNGDGNPDVFTSNIREPSRVWLGNGDATFRDSGQRLMGGAHGIAGGDFDNDGDVDVVLGSYGQGADEVWLNDGAGNFARSQAINAGVQSFFPEVADVDADGDLDVLMPGTAGIRVFLNNGSGTFSVETTVPGNVQSLAIGSLIGRR